MKASAFPAPSVTCRFSPPGRMPKPCGRVSLISTSKAPLRPRADVLDDDGEGDPVAGIDVRQVAVHRRSARRFVLSMVPLKRTPALPGAVKATGPSGVGVRLPGEPSEATMPLVSCSAGSVSVTWRMAWRW